MKWKIVVDLGKNVIEPLRLLGELFQNNLLKIQLGETVCLSNSTQ